MDSLGAYLKSEREAKGVSIDEIARLTNINKKFLLAIEIDASGELPSHTVTIGFLRAYSKCIDIDSDEVVERYNEHLIRLEQATVKNLSDQKDTLFDSTNIKFLLTIAGSLASIALLVFMLTRMKTSPREEDISATVPGETGNLMELPVPPLAPPEKIRAKTTVKPEIKIKRALPETKKERGPESHITERKQVKPAEKLPAASLPLELVITAHERAWLNVLIDGNKTTDVILPENQTLALRAEKSFLFSTGNVRGIHLFLNDKPITMPQKKGRVLKKFLITGDEQSAVKTISSQ